MADKKLNAMKRAIRAAIDARSNSDKPGFSSFRNQTYGLSRMSKEDVAAALSDIGGLHAVEDKFRFSCDVNACQISICDINESYAKAGFQCEVRFQMIYASR